MKQNNPISNIMSLEWIGVISFDWEKYSVTLK